MAHARLRSIRRRYGFACGYCRVSEIDAGGELTVDHFVPESRGGDDSDDNLVYACPRCNWHKQSFQPSALQQSAGARLLHPLLDDLASHLREDLASGELYGLTPS